MTNAKPAGSTCAESLTRTGRHAPVLQAIGRAAAAALHDELALAPKPGLVSFVDSGSHKDMDAHTFMRSINALRPYFRRVTELGYQHAQFDQLQACGLAAEASMLSATGGVNTHRGAIFTLGLLCASAGTLLREGRPLQPGALREAMQQHWGRSLHARCNRSTGLAGDVARRRYGLTGAAQEAALGFPILFDKVLPALESGLACGLPAESARLDALLQAMAALDDCNVAHRGGVEGLRHVQECARTFLKGGGARTHRAREAAWVLHRDFVSRNLSPGGAADMLAAACWMVRVQPGGPGAFVPCVTD